MSRLALQVADTGWHMEMDGGWWIVMVVGMALFWGAVILGAVWLVRELVQRPGRGPAPLELLDRRLAEGAISPAEYRERRVILTGTSYTEETPGQSTD